ncbi:MAG: GntR family transcriptional regulator [Caldisphaera sp.]|jgi:DNA-binding GntR family transcriptional regulator|nr:GntR family transcriptional regulator [Caldisphaera sp.]PMP88043.1 MAG: GntR family transcriptional regulator [Caldisphaera sp.]
MSENETEKQTKYSDIVYDLLKKDILNRRFEPKDKLSETALAKIYNVSRTPVREALHKLEKEGLVVKLSDGYHVGFLTKEQILKLFEVRAILEGLAAERAALNRNPELLKRLREAAEAFKKINKNDALAAAQANSEFHDIIADLSDNEYLRDILKDIRNKLAIVRIDLFASVNRVEQEIDEHWKIYEAIEKGDPKEAREAALRHQNNLIEFVKSKKMVGGLLI